MTPRPLKPCRKCGGDKEALGPCGRWHCADCRDLLTWQKERRATAHLVAARLPCDRCKGLKEAGRGLHLCARCRADGSLTCLGCGTQPPRAPGMRLCEACFEEAEQVTRVRKAAWARAKRAKPLSQEEREAASAAVRRRRLASSVPRETQRIDYRLKAEREGRVVATPEHVMVDDTGYGPPLPSLPLALAIDRLALAHDARAEDGVALRDLCAQAGIQPRAVYAWRVGERPIVHLYKAIGILDALDLAWWNVWTEESMRIPERVECVYRKDKRGYRQLIQTVRYGDLGPDLEGLKAVRTEMERTKRAQRMAA